MSAIVSSTAVAPLRELGVVAFGGSDAEAFLHAQTANDVLTLAPGAWQWNCCLTPQGRTVALFALLRLAAGELVAVLPATTMEPWLADLKRYVFRSKVRFAESRDWQVAGAFGAASGDPLSTPSPAVPSEALASAGTATAVDGGWRLAIGGLAGRTLALLPATAALTAEPVDEAWRAADIADGFPRLAGATAGEHTPHALALQRFGAFSVKKGCYPGQEIVARTHFLGRNKRRPVHVEGAAPSPPAGTRLLTQADGSEVAADVIDAVRVGDGIAGLAIARGEPPATLYWRDADAVHALRVRGT